MNEGKSVNFSVIKQKIIKTDEVLRLYTETNNKLKGVQETCKAIKLKYDQTVLNLNRLQLENERCSFNLGNVKSKCETLEKENEKLREQKFTLEDQYNQQTVQSQLNIRELEDQLRMLQEIRTSAESISPKKKRSSSTINESDKKIKELEDKIKKLEEREINSKNEVTSLNAQNTKLSNDIIITEKKHSDTVKKLQNEYSDLVAEVNEFKSQVNKANSNLEAKSKQETALENLNKEKDIEISELRKKISTLIADENRLKIIEEENEMLKQKLVDQEKNLFNAKENNSTRDIYIQTDELTKKHTRTIRIQTLESMKTLSQQDLISSENRTLKQTILDRDAEIFKLKARPRVSIKHCHTQTEVLEYDTEFVKDILTEMRNPFSMLSPMSSSSENLNLDDILSPISEDVDSPSVLTDIPDIVITPPTPIVEKKFEKFTDTPKTVSVPATNNINISPIEQLDKSKNSKELENKGVKEGFKKVSRRKMFISDTFVKLRKSSLKRILNKQYVFKKEIRRTRKFSKQDCILKALRTLRRLNINFTISNESKVPKWWTNHSNYDSFKYPEVLLDSNQQRVNNIKKTCFSTQRRKSTQYLTEKLNCVSKNCNNGNSCMLLNKAQGITELLGFFNVKNENVTPSSSRIGDIVDNKHLNCLKSLNPISDSEMTRENLLDTLADLVSQKLREKKNFPKRKQKPISEKSDSFYSDTEPEIERLFATPDDSVLRRNKMLLKRAKHQNLRESAFAPNLEGNDSCRKHVVIDGKITPSKLTNSFEETEGSETEINSFGLGDDTSWIENKNVPNTVELNPANECMENCSSSMKCSTCPLEANKMFKLPLTKSVKKSPSGFTESIQKEDKPNNYEKKLFTTSTNYTVLNESTERCDSFQYLDCPEIISPLSSVMDKDSPRNKHNQRSLQTEEKWLKENEEKIIELTPLSRRCLKFSNFQDQPDLLNNFQSSIDKLLMESPALSACSNKNTCLPKQNTHDGEENTIRTKPNRVTHLSTLNISTPKFSGEYGQSHCNSTDSIDFMEYKQFEHDISFSDSVSPDQYKLSSSPVKNITKQILNVLPVAENTPNTLTKINKIEDVPSCPQSPINDYEKHLDNKIPKIIPSERLFEQDILIGSDENDTKNVPTSYDFSKQEEQIKASETKTISSSNDCNEQDVLAKVENMPDHQTKTNELYNITCSPASPVENIIKEILNELPDEENSLPEFNKFETMPSCPQSPVNNYEENFKIPKIIPSERLRDENNTENASYDFLKQAESIKLSETKIISSNNDRNEQIILDAAPKLENIPNHQTESNKLGNITSCPASPAESITKKILNVLPDVDNISNSLSEINETDDIPSCPQSPVNNYEENNVKFPKIIPLERLRDENNTENTSHGFSKQEETIKLSKTKIISSNNDCNEQIILDALPKVKNIPRNQTESNKLENITDCPASLAKSITKKILNVLPDVDNISNSLSEIKETDDIPSCPQSPVNNYEEDNVKFPKIIPLERLRDENNTENTSHGFSKQEETIKLSKTKIISSNNDCNEQIILDALPKVENIPNHQTESNELENITSCPASSAESITKRILNVLPDVDNISNSLSEINETDDVPSCPQSPINNYEENNIKTPKIIPLERLFEQDTIIGIDENNTENTSHDFSKQEETIYVSKTNIKSSYNDRCVQLERVILGALPKEQNARNHELKTNEIENIASPVEEKLLCMPIKTVPSEKLDELDITGDFDKKVDTDGYSNSPESNDEYDKCVPILPLNNRKNYLENTALDLINNECQTTKCLKTTAAHSSPTVLRRSKRACKKISYSELLSGSSSESCDTERVNERLTDSKSTNMSKISKVESKSPVKSQLSKKSLNESFSIASDISNPIKRKRGRPRKYSVPESNSQYDEKKDLSVDDTNCIEKQEEILEDKNFKKISQENSIAAERNINLDMFADESNPESRAENITDNFSGGNRITNLLEQHDLRNELLTDNTNFKENNVKYNVVKEEQDSKEAVVDTVDEADFKEINGENIEEDEKFGNRSAVVVKIKKINEPNSLDTVLCLKKTSDVASERERTSYWETNEFHDDLIIDEMNDENNEKKEKLDNKNTIVSVVKSEKTVELNSPDTIFFKKTSDMASEGETSYWETNELHNNLIKYEAYSKEIKHENIEKKEKLDNKNTVVVKNEKTNKLNSVFLKKTSNISSEGERTSDWKTNQLHNDLLTDEADSKGMNGENVEKEDKLDNENTVVVNSEKKSSSKIFSLKKTSDMASERTSYLEKNEFNYLPTDESDSEISDENIEKEDKLDNKNNLRKSKKRNESLSSDAASLISDIISEKKRNISLPKKNVPYSDPLAIRCNTEENCNKSNEVKEKLTSKNTARKRKIISTLQLNTIKQFRMKRKMYRMDIDTVKRTNACDLKINPNSYRSNIKKNNINVCSNSKSSTTQVSNSRSTNVDSNESNRDDKRIHIVQNILIPANSYYAVDLMEKKKCADSKFPSNCDIRLDVTETSSQSNVKFSNTPLHKKKFEYSMDDSNIPFKRKRIVPAKSTNITEGNNDILSKILGEMNKDRPNCIPKPVITPSLPKQTTAISMEDKAWRNGIITIAESMYNVGTEKEEFKRPPQLCNHRKMKPSTKQRILMSRLSKLSTEDNIPNEIIVEFKRLTVDNIVRLILYRVSQDADKPYIPEDKYPTPLMTKTQRILLGLMVRLENENVPNVFNTFLSQADTLFFATGCGIRTMMPITRLYLAVCRLQADINRMRNFCCDAFYFMGDLAIPLLFTVLTSWIEVLPKEPDLKYYPLAKVLVQIVHLRGCKIPGFNLLPLRNLLSQYHEYPTERWNCDELFQELFQEYLRNPVKSAALQLLCKNKDTKWTYKKVNEFLKPLVYKIPAENVNFRATVIVLIGDICGQCKPKDKPEEDSWRELEWWLNSLIEGQESDLIEKSVNYSLRKLRKRYKSFKDNSMKIVDKIKNSESKREEFEKNENGV